MIYNCGTTPEDILFTTSKFIHTISIPIGATLTTTQTYDYDQNCFFTPNENNFFIYETEKRVANISLWIFSLFGNKTLSLPIQQENNINFLSSEIIHVCEKWDIKKYFFTTIDILKKHFPDFRDLNISIEKDMEIDDEWISLEITVEGDIEEVFKKYDKYAENLVFSVPWPERDRIRLSLNIE